jgi:lysophospholipase L1-like esterase
VRATSRARPGLSATILGYAARMARIRPVTARFLLFAVSSALSLAAIVPIYRWATDASPSVSRGRGGRDYGLSLVTPGGIPISKSAGKLTLVLDPYALYRNYPNQETEKFHIDDRGYRRSGSTAAGAADRTLVILGGSAAFGLILANDNETFAARIALKLPELRTVNAAVVGYLSSQELAEMVNYAEALEPAIYVVFDGWNDLFAPFEPQRRCQQATGISWAFPLIERRLIEALRNEEGAPETPGAQAATATADFASCFEDSTAAYTRNLLRMAAFARGSGASFLVAFQPELGHKRWRTEAEEKVLEDWDRDRRYVMDDFPGHYARMIETTQAALDTAGVPYIDLNVEPTLRDATERLYFDVVHPTGPGHELIAGAIAREIRDRGWLDRQRPSGAVADHEIGDVD